MLDAEHIGRIQQGRGWLQEGLTPIRQSAFEYVTSGSRFFYVAANAWETANSERIDC